MMRLQTHTKSLSGWSFGRLLFIGFLLLAFLFQSNATQTHLHFTGAFAAQALAQGAAAAKADAVKKDTGGKDNPDDCPLCQLLYGGQYVAPATLILFLPMAAVRTIEILAGVTPRYDTVSHSWRGRAPPRR